MSGDKGGAAAGEGWSARRREEGKSPGVARAGGFGAAEALRGAPSGGRAERVSGCRGRAASLQPAAGGGESKLGGSRLACPRWSLRGRVTPRSLGGPWGPISPPALKVLFPCLRSPGGRLLEAAGVPLFPLPWLLRSYSGELGGGGSRADPYPASRSSSGGSGVSVAVFPPARERFSYFHTNGQRDFHVGHGERFSAVSSVKRHFATSGAKA